MLTKVKIAAAFGLIGLLILMKPNEKPPKMATDTVEKNYSLSESQESVKAQILESSKSAVSGIESSDGELKRLKETVLDTSASHQDRRDALYLITQTGDIGGLSLAEIATSHVPRIAFTDPHSVEYLRHRFEVVLRITAIEALDEISTRDLVKKSMLSILNGQTERSLVLLARISLSGIESGQPGKIKRALDNLLENP